VWVRPLAVAAAVGALLGSSTAGAQQPGPEPNNAGDVTAPRPCALDSKDSHDAALYKGEGWSGPDYVRYPGACERLRFAYGPLYIKPGQNDVLVTPVTIDKPNQDGYITRFRPNLVDQNGNVPPVEQIHLHHGTWLSVPSYGNGPFFASGEEKTIGPWPRGYGLPIKATDQWELLYMVHSAVPQTRIVYITYDLDFIPKAKGDQLGIKPAYPEWLDVRPAGYPVFNVQRGYGQNGLCTWPKQECAGFDPYGNPFVGQGKPGNGLGQDLKLPQPGDSLGAIPHFTGGTLIGIGGHLHPGGIENQIDLIRPGGENVTTRVPYQVTQTYQALVRTQRAACRKGHRQRSRCAKARRALRRALRKSCAKTHHRHCTKKQLATQVQQLSRSVTQFRTTTNHVDTTRIYTGRAHYWSHTDPTKDGGPPTSWDFSMEVQGLPYWGVHVKPGDILRSNAMYDTRTLASYEDMGIAVTLLAPDTPDGKPTAPGVDPFQAERDPSSHCQSGPAINGKICEIGRVTHGHYAENGNYSGPSGAWAEKPGPSTSSVAIANFQYFPGDQSSTTGVPQVKLGTDLSFVNSEGAGIYHTITACKFPCLGATGSAFPLPDGATNQGRTVDFDSTELGIGAPYVGATSQRLDWRLPVNAQSGYKPGEVVTYYCRIHPFMRGAFQVVQ
jgi:hypothetical protein